MAAVNEGLISSRRYRVGATVIGADGRSYVIGTINTKARQVVLIGQLGESHVYQDDDFRNTVASGDLRSVVRIETPCGVEEVFEPRVLSPTEIKSRDERQEYIRVVEQLIEDFTWKDIYIEIQRRYGSHRTVPSRRSIERYWRIYKESYSPNCLAAHFSDRGVHHSLSMEPEVQEIILNVIESKYCSSSRFSIQDIVHAINIRCSEKSAEIGVELGGVSRRTVGRFIARLNLKNIKGRLNPRTFRLIMRNACSYLDVKEPYARVEGDSTVLDIFIVDASGNVIGCPTFYALIDTATMTIVGIHLTIQAASQVGLMQSLQFAFSPKGEPFKTQWSCVHEWPAPADIRTLVLDNGSDCHGPMIVKASQHLGMMLEYCVAGAPYQKPFIERFFGTLNTMLIKKLPGAKKSHDKRETHGLEDAQKSATLTIEKLNEVIIRWITDSYHIKKSDRLSEKFGQEFTPLQALTRLSQQYVVFPAPSAEELMEACRHYLEVKLSITREGINYQRQFYQNEYVSALFKTNSTVKVDVCINPLDCRSVHIYDLGLKEWVTVQNKNPNMPAISFEQAKEIRKAHYKSDFELSGEDYVINHINIIEDANAQKRPKGKIRENQRAQRTVDKANAVAIAPEQQLPIAETVLAAAPTEIVVAPHRRKK